MHIYIIRHGTINVRLAKIQISMRIRQWFHVWHLFCYFFPISSSSGASEMLCFAIMAFPRYLNINFVTAHKINLNVADALSKCISR